MKAIWKYTLAVDDRQVIAMPKDAIILTVQTQHEEPRLWAIVDEDADMEDRVILTMGTGHRRPELSSTMDFNWADNSAPIRYIGSYQMMAGALVFHVFEDFIRTTSPA